MGPAGGPRLHLLEVQGRPVAALYGFSLGRRFLYFQSGMDPHWAHHSVGLIMMGCVIEQSIKDGHREFDFLRGDEAYKYQWATGSRTTQTVRLFGPCVKGRCLETLFAARLQASRLKRMLAGRGPTRFLLPGEERRAHLQDHPSSPSASHSAFS
jgi:CelD/BcsL family acetyltransferase involved in cellulose biosynthesis